VTAISSKPMTSADIARATSSPVASTSERLKRLAAQGVVTRDVEGLWTTLPTQLTNS
jgi:DNA-binding IclR family transcriptional regulator